MLRCPVAEYLAAHDASDLTVATWCNLDFPLAWMWGGELERHSTLAGGANRCDLRFRAAAQPRHSPCEDFENHTGRIGTTQSQLHEQVPQIMGIRLHRNG